MADYDRNYYSRKGNKFLQTFLLVLMIGIVYYGGNLYTEAFYDISLWEALMMLYGR